MVKSGTGKYSQRFEVRVDIENLIYRLPEVIARSIDFDYVEMLGDEIEIDEYELVIPGIYNESYEWEWWSATMEEPEGSEINRGYINSSKVKELVKKELEKMSLADLISVSKVIEDEDDVEYL